MQLPIDTPLAFVSVKPVPGWTSSTEITQLDPPVESHGETITEAVREITWTAENDDAAIGVGEYQTFSISAGPLPDAESLTLPAIQVYDSGEEVGWIEPSVDGEPEPERPAPVLALASAPQGESGGFETVTTAAAAGEGDSSGLAVTDLIVGIVGLLAGLAGLALALGARRRGTSATASASERDGAGAQA